eukprot:2727174-Prymnesium_polylepis.1
MANGHKVSVTVSLPRCATMIRIERLRVYHERSELGLRVGVYGGEKLRWVPISALPMPMHALQPPP